MSPEKARTNIQRWITERSRLSRPSVVAFLESIGHEVSVFETFGDRGNTLKGWLVRIDGIDHKGRTLEQAFENAAWRMNWFGLKDQ